MTLLVMLVTHVFDLPFWFDDLHAKVDVTLEQPGFKKVSGASKKVLEALKRAEGNTLPL